MCCGGKLNAPDESVRLGLLWIGWGVLVRQRPFATFPYPSADPSPMIDGPYLAVLMLRIAQFLLTGHPPLQRSALQGE